MSFQKKTPRQRAFARAQRAEIRDRMRIQVRFEAVTAALYYLGTCDGPFNSTELAHSKGYLASVGQPARYGDALGGRSSDSTSTRRAIRAYVRTGSPSISERRRLLRDLREFATCDGPLTEEEVAALQAIEEMLQLPTPGRLAQTARASAGKRASRPFRRPERTRAQGRDQSSSRASSPPIPWYYDLLGCSPSDTDETIKRSYRQMALKLHPDTHATNPSEAASHVKAFQRLQEAYDQIRKERTGTRTRK
jgi:hypothetical protein